MVIAGQLVIGSDMQGWTYAIDIPTGEKVWEVDLNYDRLPGFVTGLVTDGEFVYTGFGSSLSCLNANTGITVWRNEAWDGGEGTTPTMTLAGKTLIASKHWGSNICS